VSASTSAGVRPLDPAQRDAARAADGAIEVTGLHTYPIKSCAGIALTEAAVTPRGLEHDRDLMLIDGDGRFVSQRTKPRLALVRPTLGGGALTVSAPGMEQTEIPLTGAADDDLLVEATVHGKSVVAERVGVEFDDWFTRFLADEDPLCPVRLVRVRADAPRTVGERYRRGDAANQLGFADGQPILLASETSLAVLNGEMEAPVPMNRFRPNIVVGGPALPAFDEDYWTEVALGALRAYVVKGCDRCAIPDVDQRTATTGKAVRRALTVRRGVNAYDETNKGVFFAQNLNHVYAPGVVVGVGDSVEVIARASQPNVALRAAATR